MSSTTRPAYTPGTSVVDITAPGGIEALLAFHRATFGDARMDAGDDGGSGSGDTGNGAGNSAGAQGAGSTNSTAAGGGTDAGTDQAKNDGTLPDDPIALKAEIERLRRENASSRVNAKTQAADEARQQLVNELGKALGLVKDDGATPTAEQLTAQVTQAQQAARQSAVELAVYKAAGTHQGDPNALLDSRAFLAKVADLDPAAADFQTKVSDAIKAAVTENPKLKAAPVAGASSVDHAGGSGERRTQPSSLEAATAAAYQTR